MSNAQVAVILPALNEEGSVEPVVTGFLAERARVIVVDNGSTDGTSSAALRVGAEVVLEKTRGYGNACLAGISYLTNQPPSVVVFADCDGTIEPRELQNLVAPIEAGDAELVLGRRVRVEKGALPMHQKAGNAIALILLRALFGVRINDIPPFRAVRWPLLAKLNLSQKTYGFPVETVVAAARSGGRIREVDMTYRRRIEGRSKVAGTLSTALAAGLTMLSLIITLRFKKAAI